MDAIITVGLGWGDEGKGATVDYLVARHKSNLVVRYSGGAQCAHNVYTPEGKHHTYSQVGSGTFAGAHTLLLDKVLVNPISLKQELDHLDKKLIYDTNIFVHKECLVTTPYHIAFNRIMEANRESKAGDNRHGSCGLGIGETAAYAIGAPYDMALRVKHLNNRGKVIEILKTLKEHYIKRREYERGLKGDKFKEYTDEYVEFLDAKNNRTLNQLADFYNTFDNLVDVVDDERSIQVMEGSRKTGNPVIFEAAQGVLLDENYGFHPHTTWSTTTTKNADDFLKRINFRGEKFTVGITRSYSTRHGHGPFPTQQAREYGYFDGEENRSNVWQSDFRTGHLDMNLLEYALRVQPIDGLAITCLDNTAFDCYAENRWGSRLILPSSIEDQEKNTEIVKMASPKYAAFQSDPNDVFARAAEIAHVLRKKCVGIAHGPNRVDRHFTI